jgi:nicotinic acid phosphoribosyltransferase
LISSSTLKGYTAFYLFTHFSIVLRHIPERSVAVQAFTEHPTMYQSMKNIMVGLPEQINKLKDLNRRAAIYIDERLTEKIEQYIETTRFSFVMDGGELLINTFAESFFDNLMDGKLLGRRRNLYQQIMNGLRKLKS